jgi:hypothetical protein
MTFLPDPPSRRGVIDPDTGQWVPVLRGVRRKAWLQFVGHATRNPDLTGSAGAPRSVRRAAARALWRMAQAAQQ